MAKEVKKGSQIRSECYSHGKWGIQYGIAPCDAIVEDQHFDMAGYYVEGKETQKPPTHKVGWTSGFPSFPTLVPL